MKLFEKIDYEVPITLREFVMAVVQGESSSTIQATLPAPPTGFPLLIYVYNDFPTFHIEGRTFVPEARLNVAGQINCSGAKMEIDGLFGQVGLVLHPMAPYYLFHTPGISTLNGWKGLLDVLPTNRKKYFASISKDMKPLHIISQILEALQHLLQHRITPVEWLDNSLSDIFKHNGAISLKDLADKNDVSERHFRRKFKEIVGVPPKYYCKVIQLNSVFEIIKSNSSEKLHALALDYGYYDQAHFINDFNRLMGESPLNFLTGQFEHLKSYLGRKS